MLVYLHKHKLIVGVVPKCASTSVKRFLFEIENGNAGDAFYAKNKAPAAKKFIWRRIIGRVVPTYIALGLVACARKIHMQLNARKYQDYYKIAVLRDPISRVVSCYKSKIIGGQCLHMQPAFSLVKKYGLSPDPSFSEFVDNLGDYQKASYIIESHTRPLTFALGKDANMYDRIFDISDVDEFATCVRSYTGTDVKLPWNHKTKQKLSQLGKVEENELVPSEKDLKNIYRFFESDYDAYGPFFKNKPTNNSKESNPQNVNLDSMAVSPCK